MSKAWAAMRNLEWAHERSQIALLIVRIGLAIFLFWSAIDMFSSQLFIAILWAALGLLLLINLLALVIRILVILAFALPWFFGVVDLSGPHVFGFLISVSLLLAPMPPLVKKKGH